MNIVPMLRQHAVSTVTQIFQVRFNIKWC